MNTENTKEIIICWNDALGFYCKEANIHNEFLVYLLDDIIEKYNLKSNKEQCHSETQYYFETKRLNPDVLIELREEDGSEFIFG